MELTNEQKPIWADAILIFCVAMVGVNIGIAIMEENTFNIVSYIFSLGLIGYVLLRVMRKRLSHPEIL